MYSMTYEKEEIDQACVRAGVEPPTPGNHVVFNVRRMTTATESYTDYDKLLFHPTLVRYRVGQRDFYALTGAQVSVDGGTKVGFYTEHRPPAWLFGLTGLRFTTKKRKPEHVRIPVTILADLRYNPVTGEALFWVNVWAKPLSDAMTLAAYSTHYPATDNLRTLLAPCLPEDKSKRVPMDYVLAQAILDELETLSPTFAAFRAEHVDPLNAFEEAS